MPLDPIAAFLTTVGIDPEALVLATGLTFVVWFVYSGAALLVRALSQ